MPHNEASSFENMNFLIILFQIFIIFAVKSQNMKNLLLLLTCIGFFLSCSKDDSNDRDKFLGTYTVNESCPSGNSNYEITISSSAQDSKSILINNFGGSLTSAIASVSGNNISIPNQVLNLQGNSVTINSGTGSINGNILTITYGFSFGTLTESCTMTCTKK